MLLFLRRRDYERSVLTLAPANLIGYWKQAEASGTTIVDSSGNGFDGTSSNVTVGQPGIGDGNTATAYNGTTSYGNVQSAGLAAAFNGQEGTAACWCKVANVGVWADGLGRRFFTYQASSTNRIFVGRIATNNSMGVSTTVGGVSVNIATVMPPTADWFHVATTWSKSADQLKLYVNGVQVEATATGFGTFTGSLTTSLIGAFTTVPANVWNGSIAHVALFATPLTAPQIATLAAR